ncbi:hypothetical protein [Streptomyces sp. 35G-GA-8]|uniref:hypothetical protein n=1 Tax=Streptomyces sp. 35G-GA-8 TaxID=2939434 RepID=UPI00201F6C3B|nr:hypothetical protein [Streptomyces sp. 35G-GA-8]MCL7377469.1 hypothetical protein [Streptomyces sp. 35G-GA-8]
MSELDPWVRQGNESDPAYEAFTVYRDMGSSRSLAASAETIGKSVVLLKQWSARHGWVERCRSYDQHLIGVRTESYAVMVRKTTQQQSALTDKLFDRLNQSLDTLPPGEDPSIRWTQAFSAACKARTTLLDYNKPDAPKSTELADKIASILDKLGVEE